MAYAPGERLVLEVKDDGVGLPQHLDIDHASTLGLTLVTLLSKQLEARLRVQSSPGTTFELSFAAP